MDIQGKKNIKCAAKIGRVSLIGKAKVSLIEFEFWASSQKGGDGIFVMEEKGF